MPFPPRLDYTSPFAFRTWQFPSEVLNAIAISVLDSLILANIASLTSKLLHRTPSEIFSYRGWLRALIFAASDDPLRLFAWLRRRYIYRNPSWKRSKSRLRPARLLVPLTARLLLLFISVALIALSVPISNAVSCETVDYAPVWNVSAVDSEIWSATDCIPIPLDSDIGEVRTVAEYCYRTSAESTFLPSPKGKTYIQASKNSTLGKLNTVFVNSSAARMIEFWIQWRSYPAWDGSWDSISAYMSDVERLDVLAQLNITLSAIQSVKLECEPESIQRSSRDDVSIANATIDCDLSLEGAHGANTDSVDSYFARVISHYVTGVQWIRFHTPQRRVLILSFLGDVMMISDTRPCPVIVDVNLPMLNILPLTVILATSFAANVLVSWANSGKGNSLDSGYHIVKESLGHDTTTNPLEENLEREKITAVKIGLWQCTSGDVGHVGFIGRQGDVPVDKFEDSTLVGQCVRAEMDLEASQRLRAETTG